MPAMFDRLLRAGEGKILRRLQQLTIQVNAVEEDFVGMTDAYLGMSVEVVVGLSNGGLPS